MRFISVVALTLIIACAPPDRWEARERGIERKWLGFDEGLGSVGSSIYSALSFQLQSTTDTTLRCVAESELTPGKMRADTSHFVSNELFELAAGDHLLYRLPAGMLEGEFFSSLFTACPINTSEAEVYLTVTVAELYDSTNYAQSPRHLRNLRRMEERELLFDALVLAGYEDQASEREWGWEVVLQAGDGASARQGDELVIAYRGRYLDGRIFDDAWSEDSWLYFPWGKPDQVVRGIELALSNMRPGELRLLWVTSDYAFGAKGSRGIVDPHTPVCFELQLVDLLQNESN